MKYQTIVVRHDRSSVAVINADCDEDIINDSTFCISVIKAVTRWIKGTQEGESALNRSSNDFNVGDLSNELDNPDLQAYLAEQGIENLEINTYDCGFGNLFWDYDTVLVNLDELED